ncbi:histidine kinase, partial [Sphingomonas sp. HMWF008]
MAPALARLHRARQRLAALVDHAPDPLLAFDGKALRAVNRAARQMFDTDDILIAPPAALLEAAGSTAVSARRTLALDRRGVAVTFSVATVDIIEDDAMSRLMWLIDIQAELRAAESATLRQMLEVLGHEIMN